MHRPTRLLLALLALGVLLCSCAPGVSPETTDAPAVSSQPATTVLPTQPPATETPTTVEASESATTSESAPNTQPTSTAPSIAEGETLRVMIFDVGQADCALIVAGEHAMLIDAGDIGQDSLILRYLAAAGVTELDYLVATHPHSDHIGSIAAVIRGMDRIGMLLMPDAVHTTQTFERMLDAIEEKDIAISIAEPGGEFYMGSARVQTLAPNSAGYDDLNNYSVVLRIEYGQTVFLFTGDAEDVSENEQLSSGFDLSADVLKVGHHGSRSSTTQRYLEAVSPEYAVISCGSDNSYGHPHSDTLSSLTNGGVVLYRTDENGTVIFTSDGQSITVEPERIGRSADSSESETTAPPSAAQTYIGNRNSKIFHRTSCSTLPAEKNRIYFSSRDEAISNGHRPCKRCNP